MACKCGKNEECKCAKENNNNFEDYIKDLTNDEQPTCSIEDQESCENCGS
tara:strand:+ start:79370 stop:79519 length:150 start_codon:yes stop_codon:yes gene_type:complete